MIQYVDIARHHLPTKKFYQKSKKPSTVASAVSPSCCLASQVLASGTITDVLVTACRAMGNSLSRRPAVLGKMALSG